MSIDALVDEATNRLEVMRRQKGDNFSGNSVDVTQPWFKIELPLPNNTEE